MNSLHALAPKAKARRFRALLPIIEAKIQAGVCHADIMRALKEQGLALIPMRVYFAHGLAKVELGLGRGKREYEKRQAIAKREHEREMERAVGRRR